MKEHTLSILIYLSPLLFSTKFIWVLPKLRTIELSCEAMQCARQHCSVNLHSLAEPELFLDVGLDIRFLELDLCEERMRYLPKAINVFLPLDSWTSSLFSKTCISDYAAMPEGARRQAQVRYSFPRPAIGLPVLCPVAVDSRPHGKDDVTYTRYSVTIPTS